MRIFVLFLCLFFAHQSFGFDFSFHGGYKFGGTYLNQESDTEGEENFTKTYLMHNLILAPEIVAYDDINIYTRLGIFNSDYSEYLGGSFLGGNKIGNFQYQMPSGIYASLAYLSWTREYGSLLLGRIPLNFGLGLNLSDKGEHYLDNLDGMAIKAILGNFTLMPAYGVSKSEGTTIEASEFIVNLLYEIPEITLGAVYHRKIGHSEGTESDGLYSTDTSESIGSVGITSMGAYVEKSYKKLKLRSELTIQSGGTGITPSDSTEGELTLDAFGLAAVLSADDVVLNNKMGFGLHTGYISGDDPETQNVYEGFLADRDYEVGLILFNHVLTEDFLGTKRFFDKDNLDVTSVPDVEFLTNSFYMSGEVNYSLTEKINLKTNILLAKILNINLNEDISQYGVELDFRADYKINDITNISLDLGYLFPGGVVPFGAMAAQANLHFLF